MQISQAYPGHLFLNMPDHMTIPGILLDVCMISILAIQKYMSGRYLRSVYECIGRGIYRGIS